MSMLIKNIGDSFDDLGYPDLGQLENYLADLNGVNFSKLVHWLSSNLNQISSIESIVNEISSEEENDSFKIELSSLLKELVSPHSVDNINDLTCKLNILNYLCGELLAASVDFVKRSNQNDQEFDESEMAKQLRLILMCLGISRPPQDANAKQIFAKITECIDDEFKKRNIQIDDSILFKNIKHTEIEPKIWSKLDELNEHFKQEYEIRRRTLITRSDCTCASFKWKKENQNEELERKINEMYTKFNYLLERDISIDVADLMAIKPIDFDQINNTVISKSHQSCAIVPPKNSKLANQGLQQKLSLHKFIIGQVPDRGGGTEEAIKPEQETFFQQQNQREQQQQRQNRGNFHQNKNSRQNFNLNPNRVQDSGWNSNQQHKNNYGNKNFQSGDYQNTQYQNRNNQYQQDPYDTQYRDPQQQRNPRSGRNYDDNGRSDSGGQFNANRGNRRGRGRY